MEPPILQAGKELLSLSIKARRGETGKSSLGVRAGGPLGKPDSGNGDARSRRPAWWGPAGILKGALVAPLRHPSGCVPTSIPAARQKRSRRRRYLIVINSLGATTNR
ncbi:hypothetical protein D0544_02125 [Aestuariirhabdus litorea]|uniref:Uncharacterized protein n=1 Tax=Aestuariirhabdus litorea TaxID=2528527 RepID=A0A3P3VMW2_9GAMM|nr:hypothetical protein D0544_02125 [Aestuariirhabdus litorea]